MEDFEEYFSAIHWPECPSREQLAEEAWAEALFPPNHDRHQAQAAIWRALDNLRYYEDTEDRSWVTRHLLARLGYGS